jgi:phenylacetic acid degradation operon negative regulatory protein
MLQPNLLAHPGTTPAQARSWLRDLAPAGEALVLATTRGEPASDRRLVAAGWDLKELGAAYRRFMARFAPIATFLSAHEVPGSTAFLVRTLLIHEYRRIHLQDPLLPAALLPTRWAGTSAHALAGRIYARVLAGAESYLSVTAHSLHGPLPPALPAVRARFGGKPSR